MVSNGNNIQPSENNGKWIDLFGWGTNGNNGANPWNYGSSATYCTTNPLGDYDWGHKEIYYGDNSTTDKWRTLTKTEWEYLVGTSFSHRTVRGSFGLDYTISYVKVRVGEREVPGLLLYPDDYSTNNPLSTSASNPALIDLTDYTGCAFLPITGMRGQDGTVTNCVGMNNPQGRYWLANKTGANINYVYFGSGLTNNGFPFQYGTTSYSYFGYAVRLVSDVPTNNTSK